MGHDKVELFNSPNGEVFAIKGDKVYQFSNGRFVEVPFISDPQVTPKLGTGDEPK